MAGFSFYMRPLRLLAETLMKWYELAENPRAISELYSEVPSLQSVCLKKFHLHRDGPRMTLMIDLVQFPDRIPARWKLRGYTSVQVQLDFWDLSSIEMILQSLENPVNVAIETTGEQQLGIQVASSAGHIQTVACLFRITIHKS